MLFKDFNIREHIKIIIFKSTINRSLLGKYYNMPAFEMLVALNKEYGNLFLMPGLFGNKDVLVTMNPEDYAVLFRNEGQWPIRRNFDSLLYYRQVHRKDFFQGVEGIIST